MIASSVAKNNSISYDKLTKAFNKLLTQVYEDDYMWFAITKNVNQVNNAEVNLRLAKIVQEFKKQMPEVGLKNENLVKLRNYFFQKAIGSTNVHDLNIALQGLRLFETIPFVHNSGKTILSLNDAKNSLKYDLVDIFGNPF